jgi:glucose-1-phosphate thymidylyltransferase
MLPIANKPMLLYGLEHLRRAGISEVAVVLGPVKEGVVETLGDGSKFGLKLTYINQPEPKGLAHAVMLAESYLRRGPFVMYLGDNLLKQGVGDFVKTFEDGGLDCLVGVCPVSDPSRFGVAEMRGGRIVRLVEKPRAPKSNLALIGVYVFGDAIFEAVSSIKPSWRNELEITDAIQALLDRGKKVRAQKVDGWWKDTGRPEDLLEANQLVLSDIQTSIKGKVSGGTKVSGHAVVGKGTKLLGDVSVLGPAIIGEDCEVGPGVFVGPYTSVGDGCVLKDVEVENTIVMNNTRVEGGGRIVDSLIGSNSTIVAADPAVRQGHRLIIGERSFAQL